MWAYVSTAGPNIRRSMKEGWPKSGDVSRKGKRKCTDGPNNMRGQARVKTYKGAR